MTVNASVLGLVLNIDKDSFSMVLILTFVLVYTTILASAFAVAKVDNVSVEYVTNLG